MATLLSCPLPHRNCLQRQFEPLNFAPPPPRLRNLCHQSSGQKLCADVLAVSSLS